MSTRVLEGDCCEKLAELASEGQRFGVVYADPPWAFETYSNAGQDRSPDYKVMNFTELRDIWPYIRDVLTENSTLFMWATMPLLPKALILISDWGFAYKTCAFTWVKRRRNGFHIGLGYWTRANAELCLLGTRGHPKRKAKDVEQLVIGDIGAHSAKPSIVHDGIERLVDGPYLELFARRPREGWTAIGDQVERDLLTAE